jgi:hypothetical protein
MARARSNDEENARSASRKTPIFETLFFGRWDGQELSNSLVTLQEVSDGIQQLNTDNPDDPLSTRNPANFFKDFIRKRLRPRGIRPASASRASACRWLHGALGGATSHGLSKYSSGFA